MHGRDSSGKCEEKFSFSVNFRFRLQFCTLFLMPFTYTPYIQFSSVKVVNRFELICSGQLRFDTFIQIGLLSDKLNTHPENFLPSIYNVITLFSVRCIVKSIRRINNLISFIIRATLCIWPITISRSYFVLCKQEIRDA